MTNTTNVPYNDVMASLSALHEKHDSMYRQLLGNGQPGRIQLLETKVEQLNNKIWTFSGGLAAVSAAAHFILKKLGL